MKNTDTIISKAQKMEMRESQLWWLAVLVIMMLSLALFVVDLANSPQVWWVSPGLKFVLNTQLMRVSLLITALLICTHFRNSMRKLRKENNSLIASLESYAQLREKKHHEVCQLKDLSEQLIGITDLQAALDSVLDMAVQVTGADTASIMLRERDDDTLRIVASHGVPQEIIESTRIHMGEAIAGLVALEKKGLILNSDDAPDDLSLRAMRRDTLVSSVLTPMQVDGETRGVMNIARLRGGNCFTDDDLQVLSTLANQASIVVQKIELLGSLRNQVKILAETVSELKQAQDELVQSEKLASIGQLAGGMAHEINNPLQIILGRTELMLMHEENDRKIAPLKAIRENTIRIANIVSNLLSFSRQSSDNLYQRLEVNEVLRKTLELLEPQMSPKNIALVRDFEEGIPPVFGSSSQLQQVFTNLALNALQSMQNCGGGILTVRTRSISSSVQIDFEDTGPGINQDCLERVFEPFFTTKSVGEGTGLGLSIAYGIVDSHGGSICAQKREQPGACVTVTLPLIEDTILAIDFAA